MDPQAHSPACPPACPPYTIVFADEVVAVRDVTRRDNVTEAVIEDPHISGGVISSRTFHTA